MKSIQAVAQHTALMVAKSKAHNKQNQIKPKTTTHKAKQSLMRKQATRHKHKKQHKIYKTI